jgi:alpha-glucosidase
MESTIKTISYLTVILLTVSCSNQKNVRLNSPDGKIRFILFSESNGSGQGIAGFSINSGNKRVLLPSALMISSKEIDLNNKFSILKIEKESVTNQWINNFGERKEIHDNYNQVKLFMESKDVKINFICRVYNEGVAFAYEFPQQEGRDSITISDEKILFRFPADYNAWSAARAQAPYSRVPLSKIETGCERPLPTS